MATIIYADFTSPLCYLASRRVDALTAAGIDIDWRAVQAEPALPVTGRVVETGSRAEIEARFAAVSGLLLPGEPLPWTMPRLVSRTEAAVAGYAEAYGAGTGPDVRRLLYAAYWRHGLDIGSPEVLRKLLTGPILRGRSASQPLLENGYAVSVSGAPMTTDGWRRIQRWREEWARQEVDALPALLIDGEPLHTGEGALRRIEKEILTIAAPLDPDLPDPARYPDAPLRPAKDWVSRVGGSWSYVWVPSPLPATDRPGPVRRA